MTSPTNRTLDEQRRALRQQLLSQRELIASQLQPAHSSNQFPRSRTMRFLTRWPSLPTGVVAGAASLLTSGRLAASLITALTLAKAVHGRRSARRH